MNTIGIDNNLYRARIKKLLAIGLFASILTGIGDCLLGYAVETAGTTLAASNGKKERITECTSTTRKKPLSFKRR